MRAVAYARTGGPEVLELTARPRPEPGPGEVAVQVVVSGVNPTDHKSRSGPPGRAAGQPVPGGEAVPGQDGAGVVTSHGPGVERPDLAPGTRVWLWEAAWQRSSGTAAEHVVLPARQVVPLPAGASFDVGASLGIPALTAHRCLTVADGVPDRLAPGALAGTTVLVAGGAGAVGHAAIQLARWAGARVVATVSGPQKAALARAAGAHEVVDYRASDAAAVIGGLAPEGVDVVVEVAPGPNAGLDAAVLAPGGTVAVYATDGGGQLSLGVRDHMTINTRYQFVLVYTVAAAAKDHAVAAVSAAVADGAMGVGEEHGLPLHRFDLADLAQAHAAVEGGAVGKVLVDVAPPPTTDRH